jgi:Protein of unknown function (DUF4231)
MSTHQNEKLRLVDVPQLEALIESARLNANQKEYLRKRWLHQIRWWDDRAWEARRKYFRLRLIIVLGGVLVPFLTIGSFDARLDPWIRRTAAAVSLLVAASAALEALYGWGAIWLEKRRAAELLKVEGWLLLHRGGRYKDQPEAEVFPEFVTEVESQIAAEVGEYVAVAQSVQVRSRNEQSGQEGSATPANKGEQSGDRRVGDAQLDPK